MTSLCTYTLHHNSKQIIYVSFTSPMLSQCGEYGKHDSRTFQSTFYEWCIRRTQHLSLPKNMAKVKQKQYIEPISTSFSEHRRRSREQEGGVVAHRKLAKLGTPWCDLPPQSDRSREKGKGCVCVCVCVWEAGWIPVDRFGKTWMYQNVSDVSSCTTVQQMCKVTYKKYSTVQCT